MEYQVVISSEKTAFEASNKLEKEVNSLIKRGYKPLGGVSVSRSDTDYMQMIVMSQAMIKK